MNYIKPCQCNLSILSASNSYRLIIISIPSKNYSNGLTGVRLNTDHNIHSKPKGEALKAYVGTVVEELSDQNSVSKFMKLCSHG